MAGCIDALLTSLDLSLPASRDVAGVFVASSVSVGQSLPTLATRVAQRLADRGCAATSRRHAPGATGGSAASASTPASVVIIDRMLDVVGAASAGGGARAARGDECGCLLDRLLATLPRKRPRGNQLHIPLGVLDTASPCSAVIPDWLPAHQGAEPTALGGSLYHPTDPVGRELLSALVLEREKAACVTLQRALIDAISEEELDGGASVLEDGDVGLGVVSAQQLRALAAKLSARPMAYRHAALLEIAAAVLAAMEPSAAATTSVMTKTCEKHPSIRAELERLVLATVADATQARELLSMITELIGAEGQAQWSLSLPELLLALAFVYSARGPSDAGPAFREEDEFQVQQLLLARLRAAAASTLASSSPPPGWEELLLPCEPRAGCSEAGSTGAAGDEARPAQLDKWGDAMVESAFGKLRALSAARTACPPWHTLVAGNNDYLPLVGQIARDIADGVANADDAMPQPPATPAGLLRVKPSVAAVAAAGLSGGAAGASGAAASLFKGGLSRLGFAQATPKPSDNEVVLLVVVGAVTPFELRRVAEVAGQSEKKLLLACTRLSSPDEFVADLFASS